MKVGNLGEDLARLKRAQDKAEQKEEGRRGNGDHRQEEPRRRRSTSDKARPADLLTARRCLQQMEDLTMLVSYNLFTDEIVLERPIPRPDHKLPDDWQPRPWQDTDATHLAEVLLDRKLLKATSGLCDEVIRGIARATPRHPVRDYLRSLEWDGTERISSWLKDYAGAVFADPDNPGSEDRTTYLEEVSRKALIGAAARILRPGCKHDHVLTLIGKQGIGKSRLLRALVPKDGWFSDSLTRDLADKDAVVGLAGVWICEMAELASLNKTDFAQSKAFLSRESDKFRPPYGRCDVVRPRQVAFFATSNVHEPFKDDSGARRFWPVECLTCDPEGLAKVRDQLWAEAVHFLDSGEKWWLSPDVEIIAQGEQAKRTTSHPLIPAVQEAVKGLGDVVEIKTILAAWETRKSDWTRVAMEVAKALREMRWVSAQRRENGVKAIRWYAPEEPES